MLREGCFRQFGFERMEKSWWLMEEEEEEEEVMDLMKKRETE